MSKIIQSRGFFVKALGNVMGNLGKKALLDLSVSLAEDVWPKLATKATSSVFDKFEGKMSGQGDARAGKGFILFVLNTDDVIKIVKLIGDSGLLIDGSTETIKHEIKKQDAGFLGAMMPPMAASLIGSLAHSLIQPMASSLVNAITGKRATRLEKGQEGRFLPLLALSLMMKF